MEELELARSPKDRRLYEIAGGGTLRFAGLFSRRATAKAGAIAWSFDRRGVWRATIEASDSTGTVVGSFVPRKLLRGGSLRGGDGDFELRPASLWRERYTLGDHDRELASSLRAGRERTGRNPATRKRAGRKRAGRQATGTESDSPQREGHGGEREHQARAGVRRRHHEPHPQTYVPLRPRRHGAGETY